MIKVSPRPIAHDHSMDALNIDGTRKKVKEYFDDTLLPEVLEEMSVLQRCNK